MKKGSFQPLLVSPSVLPRPRAGLLAAPLPRFPQSLESVLLCNTWDRIRISIEVQKGLSKPVNPEIHACHLSRAGLKDKEGSYVYLFVPGSPFQLAVVSRCFVLIRKDLRLLCTAQAEGKEAPFSWSTSPSLQAPSTYRAKFPQDQSESSFCF